MVLDKELTDIAIGRNRRLMVMMPPRHGKSELCSRWFPPWYLGHWPHKNIIAVGPDDGLAKDFSRHARDVLREYGPRYFGVSVDKNKCGVEQWATTEGGGLKAAGILGTVIGRGADVMLIDDYFTGILDAISETKRDRVYKKYLTDLRSRLSPEGAMVIIATRWHKEDLIGRLLKDAETTGEEWRVVKFQAIDEQNRVLWPEKWPLEELESIRASHNASGYPWQWQAMYQQEPPDIIDSEWPSHYFEDIWCEELPEDKDTTIRVVALDPSLGKSDKSDYSALVTVAKRHNGTYVVAADLQRRPAPKIVKDGVRLLEDTGTEYFGCESNQFQELLVNQFEEETERKNLGVRTFRMNNQVNKTTRIRGLSPLLDRGLIKFVPSPGTRLLVEQLRGFPSHKHDDGPDALEMGVRLCEKLLRGMAMGAK